ncbi:SulP family inorganic anion transporter [Tenacibaculum sp. M341]|uniref:SulP family inorganic anion transporter n=1 Tax=Tenacibaculum sp. M341 TaxID=2530339 RepID=UPI0010526B3C|nr:solute carrier family 26 protein [Tenacibaculum sp. M341]TCI95098.1 solute carrier 26 family protein [Tenacibaculum sp. M341]
MLKKLFPVFQWLPNYKKADITDDLIAGLTVGIMLIPQGMAYAMIAGLPPVFGLYASLIPQIVYAFMGTSRQLAVGPVAMDSLLVASGLAALSLSGIDEYIAMAVFLSLFMGIIQLLFGVLRMGFLVNFLSKPVISGFTSGAAIIIGLSQLKHLLGIEILRSNQVHKLVISAFENIRFINFYALTIGLLAIVLIVIIKKLNNKFNKRIPAALVLVLLSTVIVYVLNLDGFGVKIVGEVPSGLPSFKTPEIPLNRVSELIPIAFTLALIAFMEAISVSKAVEENHNNYKIEANQELIALGTSNILGSLFQSYPTTGGFSRTAVNDQAGAKTGIASLISAMVVALTLLFLTPLFYYLPNAVLAAIIMVAVFGLINISYPVELFKNGKDEFTLLIITFLMTLLVGIKEGILIGVLLSLVIMVYRISIPHIAVIARVNNTDYYKNVLRFKDFTNVREDILGIRIDSQLFFGNKDFFKKQLYTHIENKGRSLKLVIINTEAIGYIDSSGIHLLKKIIKELKEKQIKIMFSGTSGPTRDILYKSGLVDVLGKENLFLRSYEAEDYYDGKYHKTTLSRKIAEQTQNKVM